VDGTEAPQAGKEFAGARDVGGDLLAQLLGTAELFFLAKAHPKSHFHSLGCPRGLSIEQMCFDAERRAVKCRARANVRDGAVTASFAFEAGARDVDAASGEKFLFRGEIQGREGEPAARSRAADYFAC